MYAEYHWKITKDFDYDDNKAWYDSINMKSSVGVEGPYGCDPDMPMPKRFRLYDDDGNLYAEGTMSENACDEPLWDYGEGMWGCTTIKEWVSGKGGGWVQEVG